MANVMLSSESSKDRPSKPFKIRIRDLKSRYFEIINELVILLRDQDDSQNVGGSSKAETISSTILSKVENFNLECDEIYKEIHRRKQQLLISDETNTTAQELQQQLQTAGKLSQLLGDFKIYLETGEK